MRVMLIVILKGKVGVVQAIILKGKVVGTGYDSQR